MVQPPEKRLVTEADLESAIDDYINRPFTRVLPHQVNGSVASSAFPIAATPGKEGSARWPVKFAADVTRFKVHIRNYSYADMRGFVGRVDINGMWWGKARYNLDANLDGSFLNPPSQVGGAVSLPSDASEWVSDWIIVNAKKGDENLLSLGWSIPASGGPSSLYGALGRAWTSASKANAFATDPGVSVGGAALDVWLECEVDAQIPAVAFVGDSITVGDMFSTCYPVRYGQLHEIWPVVFGHFGGGLTDWQKTDGRWNKFPNLEVDAAVVLCGINDIHAGKTYNDVRFSVFEVIARIRQSITSRIFLGTIMPSNGAHTEGAKETVRSQYNTWLLEHFRLGTAGVIDFARAVENPTDPTKLQTRYADDTVHPNFAGVVQMAAAVPHLIR